MGKFAFNLTTDETIDSLRNDGFRFVREPVSDGGHQWILYTDSIDMIEDDLRDRWLEPDALEYLDAKKKRASQALRHWYNKDNKTYYYLIGEKVYKSYIKFEEVEISPLGNPTRHVKTIFMLEEDPGSIEDILRARRPSYDVRQTLF